MSDKIYMNGDLLDYSGKSISRKIQISDIADISNSKSSFSYTVKIPKTSRNKGIFDYLGVMGNNSNKPYENISVDYVSEDVYIVVNGKLVVTGSDDDFYSCNILDGVVDLQTRLGEKTLHDLDLSEFNHEVTLEEVINSFSYKNGYVYASASFHSLAHNANTRQDFKYVNPSFYVHTLLKKILDEAGVTLYGNMFDTNFQLGNYDEPNFFGDESYYGEVVIPSKGVVNEAQGYVLKSYNSTRAVVDVSGNTNNAPIYGYEITGLVYGMSSNYMENLGGGRFRILESGFFRFDIQYGVRNAVYNNVTGATFENGAISFSGQEVEDNDYRRTNLSNVASMFELTYGFYYYTGSIQKSGIRGVSYYDDSGNYISSEFQEERDYTRERMTIPDNAKYVGACSFSSDPVLELDNNTIGEFYSTFYNESDGPNSNFLNLNFDFDNNSSIVLGFNAGEILNVGLFGNPRENFPENSTNLDIEGDFQFGFNISRSEGGVLLEPKDVIPAVRQIDFIVDTFKRYGWRLVPRKNDSNSYDVEAFDRILDYRNNFEDWTEKYISHTEKFTSPYGQNNIMSYEYDEGAENIDYNVLINNVNSVYEKELIKSIINIPKKTRLMFRDNGGLLIENFEFDEDDRVFVPLESDDYRVAKFKFDETGTIDIQFFDTVFIEDYVGVPYLTLDDMDMQYYYERNYNGFDKLMDKFVKINAKLNLSVADVNDLDFTKLKFFSITGRRYMLNSVVYTSGKVSSAELVQVLQ